MLFKGTARRKAVDISRAIESVGGDDERIHVPRVHLFLREGHGKDFPLLVDLLSDIYRNSVFEEAELAREKSVIPPGDPHGGRHPEEFLSDFFNLSYWGGTRWATRPGTAESVGRFDRRAVVEYFADRFRRRGIVVTVVGNLPHDARSPRFREALWAARPGEPLGNRRRVAARERSLSGRSSSRRTCASGAGRVPQG
jgi:predicted Zn-dependent peptidase